MYKGSHQKQNMASTPTNNITRPKYFYSTYHQKHNRSANKLQLDNFSQTSANSSRANITGQQGKIKKLVKQLKMKDQRIELYKEQLKAISKDHDIQLSRKIKGNQQTIENIKKLIQQQQKKNKKLVEVIWKMENFHGSDQAKQSQVRLQYTMKPSLESQQFSFSFQD